MGLADTSLTAAAVLFLLCFSAEAPPVSAKKLKSFSEKYYIFNDSILYNTIFQVEKPATISNDALQITPDSINSGYNLTYNSGRVFHKQRFKLWDSLKNTSRIASFNVSFLVNLNRLSNSSHGEGLAFAIAPDLNLPLNSYGQYLGLTNSTSDGNSSNGIVAVELDTFKNAFDPDGNHLGLNLNTVISNKTVSLSPLGIELIPETHAFYNVWINYDGIRKRLEVYIAAQTTQTGPTPPIPRLPVLISDLDLTNHVHQNSYFGFSASTSNVTQLNCVLRWNLTVESYPENNSSFLKIVLGLAISVAVLLIGGSFLGFFLRKRRVDRSNSNIVVALNTLPGMPREFRFRDLKKATENFDEKNKLGQGGYGVVYRGYLQNENLEVAVKWFSRGSLKGEDDFLAELTIINRLRHKHLVRLLGWCHKNGKLLLVYDYMPNGSLDQHPFGSSESRPLTWNLRYKIVIGFAAALHYLHNEYDQRVVHRDLKASNIMLESDFNARLGDFGLARALENEKTSYAEAEGVLGTMGYIAPECFHTGKATRQSDVYAFGAVVLEIVCGVRPGTKIGPYQFLVEWVWSLHRDGRLLEAVDERLGDGYIVEEAERLLLLGLACMHPIAEERPKTQAIVQIISGSVMGPTVPPFKPSFVWPSMLMGEEDLSLCTTPDTRSLTTSHFESGCSPKSISRENYGPYSGDKIHNSFV